MVLRDEKYKKGTESESFRQGNIPMGAQFQDLKTHRNAHSKLTRVFDIVQKTHPCIYIHNCKNISAFQIGFV